MTLIERYLKAVAAQLPAADREDIVAELRDELMARLEAREAELGRAPTEAEVEAVLREMGQPLAVAARFGAGPHHVVGPELFPWWTFGVKAALMVLVLISAVGAVARVLAGDMEAGRAIGHAFAGVFSGGLTVVGLATVAAYVIERQREKPAFLTQWRVRDLGLFEVGLFGTDWLGQSRKAAQAQAAPAVEQPFKAEMSPTARAVASAAGWGVFALWWSGALGVGFTPGDLGGRMSSDGVDYGALTAQTVALVYWPLLAFATARAGFHLIRAAAGAPVRLTALGDLIFAAASLGLAAWFWTRSPFAPVIGVDTAQAFVDRVQAAVQDGAGVVATVLMVMTAFVILQEVFTMVRAALRLAKG